MKTRTDTERRQRQAIKYARIVALSKILDTRETIPVDEAKQIADALRVSQRTIYRDIGVIREARTVLVSYATIISGLRGERKLISV